MNFGKGDVMSCWVYRGVKLLEHAMKLVEKLLERRLQCMVKVDTRAIWFYARQRDDRCSVHFEEITRGVLRQGEEVVYVLLLPGEGI